MIIGAAAVGALVVATSNPASGTGVAQRKATHTVQAPSPSGSVATDAATAVLRPMTDALTALGQTSAADTIAWVEMDQATMRVIVALTNVSALPGLVAKTGLSTAGYTVVAQQTPYGLTRLNAARQAVIALHAPGLAGLGIDPSFTGIVAEFVQGTPVPDVSAVGVPVRVDMVQAPQLNDMTAVTSRSDIFTAPPAATVTPQDGCGCGFNRSSDIPYFWMGAQIIGPGPSYCTLGFPVKDRASQLYAVTDGHCGPGRPGQAGDAWATPAPNNYYVGTVSKTSAYAPNGPAPVTTDAMLIPTNISAQVWNGTYNTTSSNAVPYFGADAMNEYKCYSGAFSGTQCGYLVKMIDYMFFPVVGGSVYELGTETVNSQLKAYIGSGDSGAPVGDNGGPSSGARTTGLDTANIFPVGYNNPSGACDNNPPLPPNTARHCSAFQFSNDVAPILSAYQATYSAS